MYIIWLIELTVQDSSNLRQFKKFWKKLFYDFFEPLSRLFLTLGPHALKSIKGVRGTPYCDVLQFEINNKIQHKSYPKLLPNIVSQRVWTFTIILWVMSSNPSGEFIIYLFKKNFKIFFFTKYRKTLKF